MAQAEAEAVRALPVQPAEQRVTMAAAAAEPSMLAGQAEEEARD